MMAGWVFAVAALVVGGALLVSSWELFNQFAVNRTPAYPAGWHVEIMFWYALPGFQAGVLVGLLPWAAARRVRRSLVVMSLVVWGEIAVNAFIVAWLVSRGVLF